MLVYSPGTDANLLIGCIGSNPNTVSSERDRESGPGCHIPKLEATRSQKMQDHRTTGRMGQDCIKEQVVCV